MADLEVSLPKAPELVIDLPAVPVLVIELPTPSVYFLPAGFIPPFIPETAAEASGEGTAIVRPIAVLVAVASGSGAGRVTPAGVVRAVATGSGTSVVTAVAVFATTVAASGSGTATVRPSAVVGISAAGSGSAAAGVASAITAAIASGAGSAIVRPAGAVQAQASGSGAAIVPGYELGAAYPTSIAASGEGTATVTAMAVYSTIAIAFGTGTAVVTPAVSVSGAASGSGSAVVASRGVARAVASGSGTSQVPPSARTTMVASGSGTATVTATSFVDMGMRKNTDYSIAAFASNVEVPNWLAAAEFPGSVVTGNKLGPASGTATKTVQAAARSSTSNAAAITIAVMQNSTVIGTFSLPTFNTTIQSISIPSIVIAPGDLLWLRVSNSGAARTLIAADTYLFWS